MASCFDTEWFCDCAPMLNETFASQVTISDGQRTSTAFEARRSNRVHEVFGQDVGLEMKVTTREFIFKRTDCMFDGIVATPVTGWRITDDGQTYEIQPPNNETPSVEAYGEHEWLVHAKEITL